MILINSAEFDYARIDLSRDIFFAGDNGTGKTSTIIALFYLFSGSNDSRKLGISSDKKSFKEYYFPDERNSFLIYVFDEFFIFMYKQNGEVFKRFSRQKSFDISRIITHDKRLKPFKEIQSYLKTPTTYLAKGHDYREIIYGQNPKYHEFKITDIRNYDIFVELFNQTFNVDKSIVDAQSIKRAIQKSLNVEEKNIEFNYENYMSEVKGFQEAYLFFQKFEKESKAIESAFRFQDELLEVEREQEDIQAQMLYRQSVERGLVNEKERRLERLYEQQREYKKRQEQKERSLNRLRERFAKEIALLQNEIESIEKLKSKFTPQRLQEEREHFEKLPFLEKEQLEKQQQLTLLEADIINELSSIDQDIVALRFKRDSELKEQKARKLEQLKAQLAQAIEAKRATQREEREHTEHKLDGQIGELKAEIEKEELEKEKLKTKANELYSHYQKELNLFVEEQFRAKKSLQNSIEEQEAQERKAKKALRVIEEQKEELLAKERLEKQKIARTLWEERSYLNQTIQTQRAILYTTEGSFKAFLQQSGISWERELYPFMDSSLLSMSNDVLKPKLLRSEELLGVELDSSTLKQIPTQEEAEEAIREAKVKKQQLLHLYRKEKAKIQKRFKEQYQALEKEKFKEEYTLKSLAKSIEVAKREITKIDTLTIPNYENEIKAKRQNALEESKKAIEKYTERIANFKGKIKELQKQFKTFLREQREELESFKKELNSKSEQESIEAWYKEQREKLTQQIEAKEKSRKSLSKDDVIGELKEALKELKKQIKIAQDAHYFLEEYNKSKEFIEMLSHKKSRLIIAQQNKTTLEKRLSNKQQDIIKSSEATHKAIEEIKEEIAKLQQGLEQSRNLELEEVEPKESRRYLVELLADYKAKKVQQKELKVNLKETLSRINSLKNNPFSEIRFKLENFSLFDRFSEDLETIERLYELREFKEKQFEPLKQATNEEYLNFIQNEIPSKLGSLSHSEDRFQEQVKKINKNLSTIDFSIVKNIKIKTEVGNQRSVMTLLNEMNSLVQELTIIDKEDSLFFDKPKTNQDLQKIANLLTEIKEVLKGGAITLLDTIDLSLEFTENGTTKTNVTQIKNESSTGGTILLKMALAVSILGLYTNARESTFFLILDEVSRLHSHNQDLLRAFANSRGFRIVFVTPEPVYAKPDEIKYYKFRRREDNRFEVVGLNV